MLYALLALVLVVAAQTAVIAMLVADRRKPPLVIRVESGVLQ